MLVSVSRKNLTLPLKSTNMDTKDSNGNILSDGDSVHVVKDLKIKGMANTLKRGNVIKSIRLTGSPDEVECKVGKSTVVLKTQFLKKA